MDNWEEITRTYSDLPTHPYLTVVVQKLAVSMDVHPYFSKYGHSFQKVWNRDVIECEFVASKADCWALMKLSFIYICVFQAISAAKHTAGPDWSKKVFEPVNIDFYIQSFTKVSHLLIWRVWIEAVGDKWQHETNEEEEECTKLQKQTPTRQQQFKKGRMGINKSSTHGALLLMRSLIENDFCRCEQNKVVRV